MPLSVPLPPVCSLIWSTALDCQAEGGVAGEAGGAETAGHVEGQRDAVTLPDAGHARADLLDDSHVLVAEHDSRLGAGAPLVHVQVRAADRGAGDAHHDVGGCLDARVVDLLDGHLVRSLVHYCLHRHVHSRRLRSRVGYPDTWRAMPSRSCSSWEVGEPVRTSGSQRFAGFVARYTTVARGFGSGDAGDPRSVDEAW
jgi:hypothetical protein